MTDNDREKLWVEMERFSRATLAANTDKSYRAAWQLFNHWCEQAGRIALPATSETAALWATSMLSSGLKTTTVEIRLSGVAHKHKCAGYPSPLGAEVRRVINGARRLRHEQPEQKRALTAEQLWRISRLLDTKTAHGLRDRAMLVLGFAGAFRISEIVGLNVDDVTAVPKGLLILLRWSKTDQEGEGRLVSIFRGDRVDTCPVRTLRAWLDWRGNQPGPVFVSLGPADRISDHRLTTGALVQRLKHAIRLIGLDTHLYAGHSLRAGYCTEAGENGATEIAIMRQTGHKTAEMVHRYIRPVTAFGTNPLAGRL